ncbi:MAG: type II secretion system ATPase GspE [Gammaproteobacteria bacterium]
MARPQPINAGPQPASPQYVDEEELPTVRSSDIVDPVLVHENVGHLLVERGKLERAQLKRASALSRENEEPLGSLLVQLGFVAERDFADALASCTELDLVEAQAYADEALQAGAISPEFLKRVNAVPLKEVDDGVKIAMADPLDRFTVDALRLALGRPVHPQVGVASDIQAAIARQYGDAAGGNEQVETVLGDDTPDLDDIQHLRDLASEAPIIRLVNRTISRALDSRASDIHIEPFENRLKVRYRVDGVLRDVDAPPVNSAAAVISRIKVMANLDIAERRVPQDGRIKIRVEGREIDMRISTVPTMHGESVVMRLLDKASLPLDFEVLGFEGRNLARLHEMLSHPHGIILVTGPTGSGKTTTLYAALHALNTDDRKILTVEDPVEYQLEGINQIQIKDQVGLTFASALRAILRQDPDVIMIGEMRDLETARIAVQASLTGHLVFSTLHTNDAPSSVTRMLDMGVADHLVTSTVVGVLAQRLVRTLCPDCAVPYKVLPEVAQELRLSRFTGGNTDGLELYRARGCDNCEGSGYRGRTTIAEILPMTDPVRQAVLAQGEATAVRRAAEAEGIENMHGAGMRKALAGLTTVEEVERVTREA